MLLRAQNHEIKSQISPRASASIFFNFKIDFHILSNFHFLICIQCFNIISSFHKVLDQWPDEKKRSLGPSIHFNQFSEILILTTGERYTFKVNRDFFGRSLYVLSCVCTIDSCVYDAREVKTKKHTNDEKEGSDLQIRAKGVIFSARWINKFLIQKIDFQGCC